jgi:hypothetical protein
MITLPNMSPVPSGSHQHSRTYAPPSLLAGVCSQGYLLPLLSGYIPLSINAASIVDPDPQSTGFAASAGSSSVYVLSARYLWVTSSLHASNVG